MRWTTWTLSLAAVALLVVVGTMVSRQSRVTPEEFLQAVERRIEDGRYDREQTLLNLDQVLERARAAADPELETRVLARRGRLLMELGAWDRARRDLLAVAERRPDDREVENALVELETRAGDFAAAEARVRRELEREPESPTAWTRLGRLHRLTAQKHEATAVELMARRLAPDDLRAAQRSALRAAALDAGDLARPALFEELRKILRDEQEDLFQQVLRSLDRASESAAEARDAYARALGPGLAPEPLAGLLQLFAQAGRPDLAADLASSTLRYDVLRSDVPVARALLESLEELGRFRYGSELARQWTLRKAPLDGAFLSLLARIAYAAERWELLFAAGSELRGVGSTVEVEAASFYQGLGLVRGGQPLVGRQFLRQFVASTTPEPVPGARAAAWRTIADASRVLGEPEVEREALQGAIELEPDFSGELHLRLAELLLAAPHGGFRAPERRFAYGMSLLPERSAELLPRWHAIGERELASIGFDPEAVRSGLRRNRIWTPSADASPYELYRLAEIHLAAGDLARARSHLDRLLDLVPEFLPAMDLIVEVEHRRGDRVRLLAAVAQRVAAGGRTPETSAILREIPFDELRPESVHRLMRADPEYFGRIAAARALRDAGRAREALALLATIPGESLGDEARILAARLHLAAGQPAEAWGLLAPLGRGLGASAEAAGLAVRAAAFGGTAVETRGLLRVLAAETSLPRALRLEAARVALAAGETEGARALLDALDARPATRGGDLCVELAIAAALAGEAPAAALALARAEAFETRGAHERAALSVALHADESARWKALAQRVAARLGEPDPLLAAALLVLQGRAVDARLRVEAALAREGDLDARWLLVAHAAGWPEALPQDPRIGATLAREAALFAAAVDRVGDARAAAGFVALTLTPEGQALALAQLRALEDAAAQGPAWRAWLRAALERRAGNLAAARSQAALLRERAPDFPAAWVLAEELDPELGSDPARLGQFRAERLRALGGAVPGGPAQLLEDRAHSALARGDPAAALQIAASAALEARPSAELAVIAGRALLALGRPREAVERLARALAVEPGPSDPRAAVGLFFEAVDAAQESATPLPQAESQALFRRLVLQRVDDPRIVLAMARLDLDLDPRNPGLGVRRALARLDEYRARFRGRALDGRVLGAAADWIDFLAELDPRRALDVAAEELDLAPGSLATWMAAARAREALGDRRRALAELALVARIRDRGEVSREILRIRSRSDQEASEIEAAVAAIAQLEGRPAPDASLRLLAARSYLNLGPRLAAQAQAAAQAVLDDPEARAEQRNAAAVLASIAILARAREAEAEDAGRLLAAARPLRPSRLEEAFVSALRGVARPRSAPGP
ncbi:MAG: hypothetical protein JNK02_01530 [Planctomycetes bacterium]|nr:hypothetical protein [Planctomycetota bacterium]